MSDKAVLQRRNNLRRTRIRSDRETAIIKRLIWQSRFDSGPRPSQRALGRQFSVWPSYVCKVQKQSSKGLEALASGRRVTLNDLAEARRFTERIRQEEPGLLAPAPTRRLYEDEPRGEQRRLAGAMTADEIIAEQRRKAEEWKRKNPLRYDNRRRISVPIPH
jgi:hypothetical protein